MREETHGKDAAKIQLPFRSKAIYYYWNIMSRQEWKCAPDPLDSAKKWITKKGAKHQVALLDVEAVPGTRVMAFQVIDFMQAWATKTEELAMDSTCEFVMIDANVES